MVDVVISNKVGLHARPAAQFCAEVKKYDANVKLIKDGKEFDAKSVIMIMTAGIEYGDKIKIVADGKDAGQAEKALAAFLNSLED